MKQVCDGRGMFLIVFIVNILAGTMALGAVLHSGTAIVLSFVVLIISGPLQKLIYNKLLFWE